MSDHDVGAAGEKEEGYYYVQYSHLRVGEYVMIMNRPCQIFHTSRYRKGRHTKNEYTVYGKDIFNGALYEVARHDERVKVPVIKRMIYKIVASDGTFLSLVCEGESGKCVKHIQIPDTVVGQDIRDHLGSSNNGDLTVTVLSAMGEHMIEAVTTVKG